MEGIPVPASDAIRPRRVVASYGDYRQAERAVDYLSDEGFPVERVTIVGSGLRIVDRVTGGFSAANTAGTGAFQGGLTGLLFALLLGFFFTVSEGIFVLAVSGIVLGAAVGGALGALAHSARNSGRDFASRSAVEAEAYEVHADEDLADEANALLLTMTR